MHGVPSPSGSCESRVGKGGAKARGCDHDEGGRVTCCKTPTTAQTGFPLIRLDRGRPHSRIRSLEASSKAAAACTCVHTSAANSRTRPMTPTARLRRDQLSVCTPVVTHYAIQIRTLHFQAHVDE